MVKKSLSVRTHICTRCGVVLDRDHNAALNILAKALDRTLGHRETSSSQGGGKRFWTDCLYSSIQTDDEQAGWMKEEPPVIYAGECQKRGTMTLEILTKDGGVMMHVIKYITIWNREADAVWCVGVDISHRDAPLGPGHLPYGVAVGDSVSLV